MSGLCTIIYSHVDPLLVCAYLHLVSEALSSRTVARQETKGWQTTWAGIPVLHLPCGPASSTVKWAIIVLTQRDVVRMK
jgi:hypothetical protein